MKPAADVSEKFLRAGWWLLSALAIGVVVFIRMRFLQLPLERDEGEYAYTGQLMLQGIPPYQLACNMKLPGAAAAYALLMSIFGQTTAGVHLGLLLVNAATIVIIFLVGRHLLGHVAGLAAAAAYAVLSLNPYVLGTAAHATHFVVLPVLGGFFLLLQSEKRPSQAKIFASGLLFGTGVLMKQPALFFVFFGTAYLIFQDFRRRLGAKDIVKRASLFLSGVGAPVVATFFILWWFGVLGRAWFWTVDYGREYGSQLSLAEGAQNFIDRLPAAIGTAWPLWVLAGLGLLTLGLATTRRAIGCLAVFLFFALLATTPGFYFRQHYFVVVLPAISLLAGAAVALAAGLNRSWGFRFIPLLLFGIALGFPIVTERAFFFQRSLFEADRMLYGTNPFPEAVEIGGYLRANTAPTDTIAVLGSEPEIYFYSGRHSATCYIYTYALMEPQKYARQMQEEMIREIEAARPKFLVLVIVKRSWAAGRDSDKSIFAWANKYCDDYYEAVGLVNIHDEGSEVFFSDLPKSPTLAEDYIWIYKRKV